MSNCSRNSFLVPNGCGGWKHPDEKAKRSTYSDRTDTLEQRYQQLEQVAKDMCFELEHRIGVSYRKELETCGVSLDD